MQRSTLSSARKPENESLQSNSGHKHARKGQTAVKDCSILIPQL